MYYESRSHTSHPVSGPEEAVRLIHNGELSSNRVPIWTNASKDRIALVPDGNINDPFFEVAVINLDAGIQLESLTFGWMKTFEEKLDYVLEADAPGNAWHRVCAIPSLDGAQFERTAWFECGCCGERFRSTLAKQLPFDQDAGFGICPAHEHLYFQQAA